MSMMDYFAVVEFPSIDSTSTEVEAIPSIWLIENDSKCYWPRPTSSEKFRKMVATRKLPEEDWNIYDVKRVFGKYDDLLKARAKAKMAEETSDLNSDAGRKRKNPKVLDVPVAINLKKKSTKRNRSPSESSAEESSELDSLPNSPPKFSSTQSKIKKGDKTVLKASKAAPGKVGLIAGSEVYESQTQGSSYTSSNKFTASPITDGSRPGFCSDVDSPRSSVHSQIPLSTFGTSSAATPGASSEFNRQVLQDLHLIKIRLTQIENTQTLISAQLTSKNTTSQGAEYLGFASDLPIMSIAAFEQLEEQLVLDSARKHLVQYWNGLGGASAADMTRRALRRLMTDTVASQMNWRGHNGKIAFESTKCMEILTASVQGFFGAGLKNANGKLIEVATKEWLKQAANRIKQKTERSKARRAVGDEDCDSNDGHSEQLVFMARYYSEFTCDEECY